MSAQERRKSNASWGDRPRPKGLGTKHLHFDVAKSGYVRESIKSEQDTRNKFYDEKLRLERPPNVVFGETKADCENHYLVQIPDNHDTYTKDPKTGKILPKFLNNSESTLRARNDELVNLILNDTRAKVDNTIELDKRIMTDQLKAKRNLVYEQLRQHDINISRNTFIREQSLIDVDLDPPVPILPKYGTKTFLRAFPNERSIPRFTAKISSLKPGFA